MIIPRRLIEQKYIPIGHDVRQAAESKTIAQRYAKCAQPHDQINATHHGQRNSADAIEKWEVTMPRLTETCVHLAAATLLRYVDAHGQT